MPRRLVARIERDHGRLDVLVNDLWGGDPYLQFGKPLWEHDLAGGLRMLRLGIDAHAITSHAALPLMIRQPGALVIEMTDGTAVPSAPGQGAVRGPRASGNAVEGKSHA
jgi:NAD(P)-dependent dehydrogenase (short-subunit alcohol dehydrogenase family)